MSKLLPKKQAVPTGVHEVSFEIKFHYFNCNASFNKFTCLFVKVLKINTTAVGKECFTAGWEEGLISPHPSLLGAQIAQEPADLWQENSML